jgi:hypothetical protein
VLLYHEEALRATGLQIPKKLTNFHDYPAIIYGFKKYMLFLLPKIQSMDEFFKLLLITALPVIVLVAAILAFKQRLGAIRAGILLTILTLLQIITTIKAYLTDISQSHKYEAPDTIFNIYQDIACYHLIIVCVIAVYSIIMIVHLRR